MKYKFWLGIFLLNLQLVYSTTFTVTNTNDSGVGSLREAIEQSNKESEMSKVVFSIEGDDQTIILTESLKVTSGVEIDGSGKVVLQNSQETCILSCDDVQSGTSIVLRNIEIGSSVDASNKGQIELHGVIGEASATFICDNVKMAFALKRSSHVRTCEYPWVINMNNCEVANSSVGVVYGKELQLKKTQIYACRTVLSTISGYVAENVLIDGCSFYDNTGYTYVSGLKSYLEDSEFLNSRSLMLACPSGADVKISNCSFEKSTDAAIRSSNPIDGWLINIEGCYFYNTEGNLIAASFARSYVEDEHYAPGELTFVGNYLGVNRNGEKSPIKRGLYLDMAKATIKNNVFANVLDSAAIQDMGSDELLISGNYFGTNKDVNVDWGNHGGIQLQSIKESIKEVFYPDGKKEYKEITGNTFAYNEKYGVCVDSLSVNALISNNKFLYPKEGSLAIQYTPKGNEMFAPYFVVEKKNGYLYINGEGAPGSVVELFRSSSENQTALELIGSFELDADGQFSEKKTSNFFKDTEVCLSATQTFYDKQKNPRTSVLSDSKCFCLQDTIIERDTVAVGDSFLGKLFTKVGNDTIFTKLGDASACPNTLTHLIFVKPSPTIKNYYVKTTGNGNGENWKEALSPEDFALYFSLVDDDVTFHIAKGEYHPIYMNPEEKGNDDRYLTYYTQSRVNLVGGYSLDPEENEVAHPERNETILNGKSEIQEIMVMKPQSAGEASIRGIVFNRNSSCLLHFEPQIKGVKLLLDSCVFENGITALRLLHGGADIRNSLFQQGVYFALNSYGNYDCSEEVKVSNCSFIDVSVAVGSYSDANFEICNSTFFNGINSNPSNYCIRFTFDKITKSANPIVTFRNNTIMSVWEYYPEGHPNHHPNGSSELYISSDAECEMIGNLIDAGHFSTNTPEQFSFSYNVSKSFPSEVSGTNKVFNVYGSLMESNVENHGGFTPTLALLKDYLPDGTSIRMPLSATTVTEDQRGVKRFLETCIGSYELCRDTIFKNDTIKLGEPFLGKTYDKVGIHDSIFEYLTPQNGCERIVMHTLLVKPSPTIKNYYVKTSGNGNGENWKEALSPEDFALYFSLVDDDVTFHIAKGTYYPIYPNPEYVYYNKSDYTYYTKKRVNLVGGYSVDPKEGELPHPEEYQTVLSGKLDEETVVHDIILMKPQSAGTVSCRGIVLDGCKGSGSSQDGLLAFFPEEKGTKLILDSCSFMNGSKALNLQRGGADIRNCVFDYNQEVFFIFDSEDIKIACCLFYINERCLYFFSDANLEWNNSTFSVYDATQFSIYKMSRSADPVATFRNNTIMAGRGVSFQNLAKCEMIGNLVNCSLSFDEPQDVTSEYNIYLRDGNEKPFFSKTTDKEFSNDDFASIIHRPYSNLGKHGGFTASYALDDDQLPNGTSIRMPLSATTVTVDQRGVERLSETCAGSYEIPCLKKTKVLEDEAFVGSTYTFGT
ncbi:MAG: right-handed parallel beta-helix repeat-containing protein, partial [Paludibacteraceae bacterium]|nr:right-handed parallel beta-helix repeat-containing protein [Paludibacteraceae bacterium]